MKACWAKIRWLKFDDNSKKRKEGEKDKKSCYREIGKNETSKKMKTTPPNKQTNKQKHL